MSETLTEKPAALQAVDELRTDATSPEDRAYLDQLQEEIEAERRATLGRVGEISLPIVVEKVEVPAEHVTVVHSGYEKGQR